MMHLKKLSPVDRPLDSASLFFNYGVGLVAALFLARLAQPWFADLFAQDPLGSNDTFGDAILNLLIEGVGWLLSILVFFVVGVAATIVFARWFGAALEYRLVRKLRQQTVDIAPTMGCKVE